MKKRKIINLLKEENAELTEDLYDTLGFLDDLVGELKHEMHGNIFKGSLLHNKRIIEYLKLSNGWLNMMADKHHKWNFGYFL